ncbi:unnamed protein product [Meloidogyne enterolobii]|uniref:Uncharacterized protein n=1 Tax=Meloidogyne enterolobii TaxID=390850 RepID=A0ACB0XYB1_MELEN
MAHSSAPHAGLQMAISGNEQTQQPQPTPNSALSSSRAAAAAVFHQRWGVGNSANRRGSHLIGGWDSARPHSAARQQQQMLERLYTKGELKVGNWEKFKKLIKISKIFRQTKSYLKYFCNPNSLKRSQKFIFNLKGISTII